MQITLKLDKDFETLLEGLKTRFPEEFQYMNGVHNDNLNFTGFIDNFVDVDTVADASIDGNANSNTKDVTTLTQDMMKPHTKLLSLSKIYYEIKKEYGKKVADDWYTREYDGTYYLHNAHSASFKPYCFAYDLDELAEKGLFFIDRFQAQPAQHLDTFNKHVLQFVSWTCNRSTGAVGIPSYLVYSYYFWKKDIKNGYVHNASKYRDQEFQSFIYNMNQPFLRVTECAFTNLSIFDREYFTALFGGKLFPDGSPMILDIEEFMEYQKSFMRVLSKVRQEQYMTFPVMTYSLLYQFEETSRDIYTILPKKGRFVDDGFARWCSDHNTEWNDSNFYVGNDVSVLSNCCRLLSDTSEMDAFVNSIGGTSLKIGSAVVNTTNLRRLSLIAGNDEEHFLQLLKEDTLLSLKVMDRVRHILKRNVQKGLLPNYTHGLVDMDKQFNTLGITAMYEVMKDFGYIKTDQFGNESYSDEAMSFADRIFALLNDIRKNNDYDYPINIECVPAERANVILCQKDNVLYDGMFFGNEEQYFIYSNQWIPLMKRCTIEEKIRLGSILDKQCGGGQISHINLEKRFTNKEQAWNLLNHIAQQGLIYFAFNTKTSVCGKGHGFFGDICPVCGGEKTDEFTRIVGFLTPTKSYSKERKAEYDKRKWFDLTE